MNKKVVVGLIAVMAIAAMAMFSGCVDKAPNATNATTGIVPEVTPSNATIFNNTEIPAEEPEEPEVLPVPKPTSPKPTTGITEIRDIKEHPENFEGKRVTIIGEVGHFSVGKTKVSATYRGDVKWYWFWRIEAKEGHITALMECELMERETEPPQQFRSIKVDGIINYFNQIIVESWEYTDNTFTTPLPSSYPPLTPIPSPTPTLTPSPTSSEDAFNYQSEYTLDQAKLRPEEKAVIPFVMKYAKECKVSPCLIMAVIRQESNFDVNANGGTDVGYMQVTYDAAKDGGYKGTEQEWRQKNGLDPDQNIQYGTKYLKTLNGIFRNGKVLTEDLKATKVPDKTERLKFVLAAYNGGQGRIAKAQQICEDEGDNPERWDDTKKYLEAAGATLEKAKIIKNYVEQVIEGRDFIDGQHRGYEFFLAIRVPVSKTPTPKPTTKEPTPEEGVPGFEAVFAIAGLLAVAYLLRRRE